MDLSPATRRLLTAGITASLVSGVPSTLWALLTRDSPLAATRAAGTLLPGRRNQPSLIGGALAHFGISTLWIAVLAVADRRWRLDPVRGAVAALGIAALDLGVIGRRYPAIVALPQLPQWADHIVFGATLGTMLRAGPDASDGRPTTTDEAAR
jgi:hypothetical protein